VFNKPLIERVVTVTGSIVKKPGNYKIKIGTQIKDIIEETEVLKDEIGKIIFGGPMMGIATASMDAPVTKGTSGILFLSKKEVKKTPYNEFRDCIRCSNCLMACPIGLNPAMLSILVETENYDELKNYNILDCIECGSCSYVCPSYRPIVQFIKMGKLVLRSKK